MIADGTVDVTQSAVSASWAPLEKGSDPPVRHFAQINIKDGFFIVANEPDPNFTWEKLEGERVIVDHGGQPMAMFRFACHHARINFSSIEAIDLGDAEAMEAGFVQAVRNMLISRSYTTTRDRGGRIRRCLRW